MYTDEYDMILKFDSGELRSDWFIASMRHDIDFCRLLKFRYAEELQRINRVSKVLVDDPFGEKDEVYEEKVALYLRGFDRDREKEDVSFHEDFVEKHLSVDKLSVFVPTINSVWSLLLSEEVQFEEDMARTYGKNWKEIVERGCGEEGWGDEEFWD